MAHLFPVSNSGRSISPACVCGHHRVAEFNYFCFPASPHPTPQFVSFWCFFLVGGSSCLFYLCIFLSASSTLTIGWCKIADIDVWKGSVKSESYRLIDCLKKLFLKCVFLHQEGFFPITFEAVNQSLFPQRNALFVPFLFLFLYRSNPHCYNCCPNKLLNLTPFSSHGRLLFLIAQALREPSIE